MRIDTTTLQMALIGYEAERQKIEDKIAELQRQLGPELAGAEAIAPVVSPGSPPARTPRRMSAAARKRIAEAQKKRWAAFRKKRQKNAAA